ncbi:MAG: hypothetical protein WC674_08550 [Candidatus Krumholzibacteriia bacterium]
MRCLAVFAVPLLIIVVPRLSRSDDAGPATYVEAASKPAASNDEFVDLPEYRIIRDELYEIPLKTQVEMDVIVSKNITRGSLENVLNSLHASIRARTGFKYHPMPTNVYIRIFTSYEKATADIKQPIAMMSSVDGEGGISINEILLSQVGVPSKEKYGLSQTTRMRIYKEYCSSLDRVPEEVYKRLGIDPMQSPSYYEDRASEMAELEDKLNEEHRGRIAKKYGISPEKLDEIYEEGIAKAWPL